MHDISLHLLDLIENSVTAGASVVAIVLDINPRTDTLHLAVDDNGAGLQTRAEEAINPFYTTKSHKRVGLGLSLLEAAAEQSEGRMTLGSSPELGGVRVEVRMRLSHLDRPPVGDLAATVSTMVSAHPKVEIRACLRKGRYKFDFSACRDLHHREPVAAFREAYGMLRDSFKEISN